MVAEESMTEVEWQDDGDELSLFALGTSLLRNRWRIARWMLIGGIVAAVVVFLKPPVYLGTASFVPQGNPDARSSGLASIAGQFGFSLPTATQSESPDFYAKLLKSRVLLGQIAADTFVVREKGGRRIAFVDLYEIKGDSEKRREELGVKRLTDMVESSVVRATGVVQVSVATQWPSVSLAIVTELVNGVNDYNQRTRQGQAAAERKFVEGRLATARVELRAAEDRLEGFLTSNRQGANAPELSFERDRLQRDVALQQQVFTSLTQSYEDVRIREVRDTPVITVMEPPMVPTLPESRGRLKGLLLGLLIGGLIGTLASLTSETITRRREEGDAKANEFVGTVGEVKGEMLGRVRWIRERIRR
jgi:tyrosine-protein kinase Etk/Wzc